MKLDSTKINLFPSSISAHALSVAVLLPGRTPNKGAPGICQGVAGPWPGEETREARVAQSEIINNPAEAGC